VTAIVRLRRLAFLKLRLGRAEKSLKAADSMTLGRSTAAAIALLALPVALAGPPAASASEGVLSPASYGVGPLCSAPAPGRSACLGLGLIAKAPLSLPGARLLAQRQSAPAGPSAPAAPATEFKAPLGGVTPAHLRAAYGLSAAPAPTSTQTIGIVDAYDDPNAETDLAQFDSQFGLPPCTKEAGCFRKVNEEGKASPLPPWKGTNEEKGWAQEIATDIETAHAVCPSCRILLVEAKSNLNGDLFAAENAAASLGANEISNSWGGNEPAADNPAFNHPGVVITASSGDNGYRNWLGASHFVNYPASSPRVIAVGGTRLLQKSGTWESETVWNDGGQQEGKKVGAGASGGGCSTVFSAPLWQQAVPNWSGIGCTRRAVVDVSADGDPYTGVNVYDSMGTPSGNTGWAIIGGTSVSSPIIASVFALAGGGHGVEYPAHTLYENLALAPSTLHDVAAGSNGECLKPFNENTGASGCTSAEEASSCSSSGICLAGLGYDGPSGVGTPNGLAAFQPYLPSHGGGSTEEGGKGVGGGAVPPPAPTGGGPAPQPGPRPSSTPPPAPAPPTVPAPAISALALTRGAIFALHRRRPGVYRVGFEFTLTAPAGVTATLARWTRSHHRGRWSLAARRRAFAAAAGRKSAYLAGRRALVRGRYRLTVTLAQGVSESIIFRIG
jgi:hypothetical protein